MPRPFDRTSLKKRGAPPARFAASGRVTFLREDFFARAFLAGLLFLAMT